MATSASINFLGVPYGSTLSKEIAKVQSSINGKTVTYEEIQSEVNKMNAEKKYKGWIGWGIAVIIALVVVSFLD